MVDLEESGVMPSEIFELMSFRPASDILAKVCEVKGWMRSSIDFVDWNR